MSLLRAIPAIPLSQSAPRQVVACLDRSNHAPQVASQAFALARALEMPVTLLHILESRPGTDLRPDPIEWDMRRHEARHELSLLAAPAQEVDGVTELRLADGATAEEICRFACGQSDCLLVLGANGESPYRRSMGSTAHNVLDQTSASILLVPGSASEVSGNAYRRILVPLDGSSWAESALPLAAQLAKASDAKLILAHVVPAPEFTEPWPLESDELELRHNVLERNEKIARDYLEHIRGTVAAQGISVRTLSVRGDDPRTSLIRLIENERADLIVLSARGNGGRYHVDLPYGSVAAYLMAHSQTPLLIVRSSHMQDTQLSMVEQTARLPVSAGSL